MPLTPSQWFTPLSPLPCEQALAMYQKGVQEGAAMVQAAQRGIVPPPSEVPPRPDAARPAMPHAPNLLVSEEAHILPHVAAALQRAHPLACYVWSPDLGPEPRPAAPRIGC